MRGALTEAFLTGSKITQKKKKQAAEWDDGDDDDCSLRLSTGVVPRSRNGSWCGCGCACVGVSDSFWGCWRVLTDELAVKAGERWEARRETCRRDTAHG